MARGSPTCQHDRVYIAIGKPSSRKVLPSRADPSPAAIARSSAVSSHSRRENSRWLKQVETCTGSSRRLSRLEEISVDGLERHLEHEARSTRSTQTSAVQSLLASMRCLECRSSLLGLQVTGAVQLRSSHSHPNPRPKSQHKSANETKQSRACESLLTMAMTSAAAQTTHVATKVS